MNKRLRTIVLVSSGLLLASAAAWAAVRVRQVRELEGLHSGTPGEAAEAPLCGPKSLWTAVRRLGIPLEFREVLAIPTVGDRGTALGALKEKAGSIPGLKARACRLSWQELRGLPGTAVLFVHGNHFVAVDPREEDPEAASGGRVRVYDPDLPARWCGEQELGAAWEGPALALEATPTPARSGPALEWDVCWEDKGYLQHTDVARFTFRYRNVGTKPLTVTKGRTSCGCTSAEVASKTIASGEAGSVRASVELRTKRGPYLESVTVQTNDPATPEAVVVLAGGVYNTGVPSAEKIYFGDVPQGRSVRRHFFLHDPGEGLLKVLRADVELASQGPATAVPPCSVSFTRVEPGSPRVGAAGRFSVQPGDYVVEVELKAAEDQPPAKLAGKVLIATSLPGDLSRLEIGLAGAVIPDVDVSPRALLLSDDRANSGSGTVKLTSLSGKPVTVGKVTVKGGLPLQVEDTRQVRPDTASVTVSCRPADLKTSMVEGRLVCELAGGRAVEVPVIVLRHPAPR